jgi:hypothetical protein
MHALAPPFRRCPLSPSYGYAWALAVVPSSETSWVAVVPDAHAGPPELSCDRIGALGGEGLADLGFRVLGWADLRTDPEL